MGSAASCVQARAREPIGDRCTALVALQGLSRRASKADLGAFVYEVASSLAGFESCGDWWIGLFDETVSTLPQLDAPGQVKALDGLNDSLRCLNSPIEAGSVARLCQAVEPVLRRLGNDDPLREELERQLERLMGIVPRFLVTAEIDGLPEAMRRFRT
jgi:hypothetical protein